MKKFAKTKTVYQMEITECGAACLSMVFSYFGKHIPLEQMRIESGVSRDGCTAGNMMRTAQKFNFECHGYKAEPEGLRDLRPPCIIHWNFNHFVVFEGFKGKHACINDPVSGRRKVTLEELNDSFTGVVLTFRPAENFVKEKKKKTWIGFIRNHLHGQYGSIFKLFFIGLLLIFPGLLLPVLSQVFIDDVLVAGNTSWFNKLLLFMFGTLTMQAGLTLYRDTILVRLQKKMVLLSARDFLSTMFRLPISFFDQRYVGDLTGRISNNANISNFLTGELAETALNVFVAVFYLALLLIYSPMMTIIAVCSVIINLIIMKITAKIIANFSIKLQQDNGKLAGAVCAGLSIADTLKASGTETEYVSRILGYNAKTITLEQRLNRLQSILDAIPDAVKMLADVVLLLVGGTLVIQGNMTIGMLIAFTTLFGSFSDPIEKLVGFTKNIQQTKADINRVEDILKHPLDEKFDTAVAKKPICSKLDGNVEMKNVSFGYSQLNPPVISDFSFRINTGSSVAFVGTSGCGKSTVSKLVSALYSPWEGELLFDGTPVMEIPNEILYASVSTVSQHISLFSGTVRDNLTMWNADISEADIIAAAKDACIHDDIVQKPGGYDYRLTEDAANLSGGQRQRLEIARALATNPTVLIMDEATSALDPVVEKKIIDNIKRRGCTCIIVAHRLSAIRDCDQIIVLDDGKIIQKGTHEELAAIDGHYKQFIRNL